MNNDDLIKLTALLDIIGADVLNMSDDAALALLEANALVEQALEI